MKSKKDEFVDMTQPIYWVESACGLKEAADILLGKIKADGERPIKWSFNASGWGIEINHSTVHVISKSYMFLAGFALENLMKAIYVWRDRNSVNCSAGNLNRTILFHDLRKLAVDIRLISPGDSAGVGEFLDKLTQLTIWAGRYPVPTKFQELKNLGFDPLNDPVQVENIYSQLTIMLENKEFLSLIPKENWLSEKKAKQVGSRIC
jgi:hypothetical protein